MKVFAFIYLNINGETLKIISFAYP